MKWVLCTLEIDLHEDVLAGDACLYQDSKYVVDHVGISAQMKATLRVRRMGPEVVCDTTVKVAVRAL